VTPMSSVELTSRCLDRVTADNPRLRAVIVVDGGALASAESADVRRWSGTVQGPLDGVPVLIKDNIDTAGLPCTAGSALLATLPPPPDAPAVARLRRAGAVVLGKTNLSEWGYFRSATLPEGWSSVGGQTRNPNDPARSPWGSSAGSAVAVAAGMAPLAVGTETDGSVVGPAGVAGVVGLRPQTGLISNRGVVPLSPPTDVPGAFATTLRRAAWCVAAMAGTPLGSVRAVPLAGLRLGVWRVPGMAAESDSVLDAVAERLRSAGAVLVPVDVTLADEIPRAAGYARLAEFADAVPDYLRARGCAAVSVADLVAANRGDGVAQEMLEHAAGLEPDERVLLAAGGEWARAAARARLAAGCAAEGVVAVLAATNPPAWLIDGGDPPLPGSSTPAALAGAPAVSLPAGSADGLPVGVSVFGPPTVAGLLPIALAVEQCLAAGAGHPVDERPLSDGG